MRARAFLLGAGFALAAAPVWASDVDTRHYIYIESASEVTAPADYATVEVTVSTKATVPDAAVAANVSAMRVVHNRLISAGVKPGDIATANLDFKPVYVKAAGVATYAASDPDRDKPDGYRATNELTVTVHQLDALGTLLGDLARTGATISSLSFGSSDADALYDKARQKAAATARARAEILAKATGTTLGPLLSMREGTGFTSDGMQNSDNGGVADLAPAALLTSAPERLHFTVSISGKWEVEEAQ